MMRITVHATCEYAISKNNEIENIFFSSNRNRYYLPTKDPTYLTLREMDCLYWCMHGKTAEETALLLNISKRTVEAHLENIKRKLDCYKQTDLVRKALLLRIFSL